MTIMSTILRHDHTQRAIEEVQAPSRAAVPEAEFTAHHGVDPEGIYIRRLHEGR
jgi:hypothetical protein